MSKIKAVIFDLDGTVCDTLQDLCDCTNRALCDYGLSPHTLEEYKTIVGNGVDTQIKRAMGKSYEPQLAADIKKTFKAYYNKDYLKNTRPYEGIVEALQQLKDMGLKIAVLTNKPDEFAVKLCSEVFGELFDLVVGSRPGVPVKPDPTALFSLMQELGFTKEECLYCGDSCVDMDTGRNAGVYTIGVEWGFRTRQELVDHHADCIISHPAQLPETVSART